MQRFARDNRHQTRLLHERGTRETVRTVPHVARHSTSFSTHLRTRGTILKLALHLLFNTIVIGSEIDGSFPVAYGLAFTVLILMQIMLRKPVARAFLENQRHDQPDDRAGLYRAGTTCSPATAITFDYGWRASKCACATRCALRSGRS